MQIITLRMRLREERDPSGLRDKFIQYSPEDWKR